MTHVIPSRLDSFTLDINVCTCVGLQIHTVTRIDAAATSLLDHNGLPSALGVPPRLHRTSFYIDVISMALACLQEDCVTRLDAYVNCRSGGCSAHW